MYRWLSIAAVLAVAATLAACGSTDGSGNQATVSTGDAGVQTGGKPAGDDGSKALSLGRRAVTDYVDYGAKDLGQFALTRHLMRPSIEDSNGTEYRPITLIVLSGTFKPCPGYSDAKLKPGQSFTGCSPILLPKGKQFARVRFEGDVTKDPIFWSAQ